MRVSIIVSDDDGNNYRGEAELVPTKSSPTRQRATQVAHSKVDTRVAINLTSPMRAFVKRHARNMTGPRRFAPLVAYLSKGDSHKEVSAVNVEKHWNRMKPLLGGKYNAAYAVRAR